MDRQYAQTNGLRTGYIYAGLESMNTPARLGLQMESNVVLPSVNSLQTSSTLLSLYQGDKKSRPCLVMRIDINRKTGQYEPIICIMGTFDGAPRDSLARFYQFHIVPVFPNSAVRISDKFVLHTTPHWKTKKWPAWLVCSPYPATDSTITTLWRGSEGDGFHLDEDALRQLQWEAARRRKAWQTIMADPQNKRMLQDNFMTCLRSLIQRRKNEPGQKAGSSMNQPLNNSPERSNSRWAAPAISPMSRITPHNSRWPTSTTSTSMYRAVPSGHPQTAPGPSSHGWGSNQSSYPTPGFTTTAAQAHTVNAPHRSQSWQDPQYPHSQAAENDASQEWIPVESKKAKKLRKVDEALATIQSNRLAEQSRYQSRR